MRRLIVTTVHEMEGEDCVEWALNGLLRGGITAEEVSVLRREGQFEIADRVPRLGVTLKTKVVLEAAPVVVCKYHGVRDCTECRLRSSALEVSDASIRGLAE